MLGKLYYIRPGGARPGGGSADQPAALDDVLGAGVHNGDILDRVARNDDEVGVFAFLDGADLIIQIHELCRVYRRLLYDILVFIFQPLLAQTELDAGV